VRSLNSASSNDRPAAVLNFALAEHSRKAPSRSLLLGIGRLGIKDGGGGGGRGGSEMFGDGETGGFLRETTQRAPFRC
jgi:hypothetical protein